MTFKVPPIKEKNDNASFCASLFHCRDVLHIVHLKSKSYAEHVAVESAYEGLLDMADEITEKLADKYGLKIITKKDMPQFHDYDSFAPRAILRAYARMWKARVFR